MNWQILFSRQMQGALILWKEHKNHTKTTPHIYEMPQNKTTPNNEAKLYTLRQQKQNFASPPYHVNRQGENNTTQTQGNGKSNKLQAIKVAAALHQYKVATGG